MRDGTHTYDAYNGPYDAIVTDRDVALNLMISYLLARCAMADAGDVSLSPRGGKGLPPLATIIAPLISACAYHALAGLLLIYFPAANIYDADFKTIDRDAAYG